MAVNGSRSGFVEDRVSVALLVDTLSLGGAEQVVATLATHLDRSRFDVEVICVSGRHRNEMRDDLVEAGCRVHMLRARSRYDVFAARRLYRHVRRKRIDLIHTHLIEAGILGRVIGVLARVPTVSSLHSVARSTDNVRVDRRLLQRWTARLPTRLIAVSDVVAQSFSAKWNIPRHRIETVPNAIDSAMFGHIDAREPLHRTDQPFVVTTVGRLHPLKGHLHLIRALRRVADQRSAVMLNIAGSGRFEAVLRDEVYRLDLSDRVTFMGQRRDVPAILAQSHAVAMPSLWEGLSIAALEAMAASRATILTAVGGNVDLVEHEHDGLLVPAGDDRALAAAILRIIDDDALRVRLGRNARMTVEQRHSLRAFVAAHERLYCEVLETAGHSVAKRARGGSGRGSRSRKAAR